VRLLIHLLLGKEGDQPRYIENTISFSQVYQLWICLSILLNSSGTLVKLKVLIRKYEDHLLVKAENGPQFRPGLNFGLEVIRARMGLTTNDWRLCACHDSAPRIPSHYFHMALSNRRHAAAPGVENKPFFSSTSALH
jgi:hypothetical protein